jgi:RNA polymerase sigma-70 factor (ECF subfamily)
MEGMPHFQTTLWSRIEDIQRGNQSGVWTFVERYRRPLLSFVERRGFSAQDAEDLVQEVFLRLFTKEALARADRNRGRFRSFVLGIAKHVMSEERAKRGAKKRGGGERPVPLSEAPEVAYEESSDSEFDSIWADHLLRRALEGLSQENPRQHKALKMRFEEGLSYQDIAERMERNLQQVKNDIHRARKRLIKGIKAEIADYCSTEAEYEDEVRSFLTFLGEA